MFGKIWGGEVEAISSSSEDYCPAINGDSRVLRGVGRDVRYIYHGPDKLGGTISARAKERNPP